MEVHRHTALTAANGHATHLVTHKKMLQGRTMTKTFRLPNGITCVCEDRQDLNKVEMRIQIAIGSTSEPDDEAGLTFLTQEACNTGTLTRSRLQIAEDVESKGAQFFTNSDRFATVFGGRCLARDAGDVFALMADVLRNPTFDLNEIRKTQNQIVQYIAQKNQDPDFRKSNHLVEAVFGNHPISHSPIGDPALIATFTPAKIRKRHEELLADPSKIIVGFAGGIDPAAAHALALRYFGDLPAAAPASPVPTAQFTGGDIRESADMKQLTLTLAFPAAPLQDPQRYSFLMLQQLLSGGMSGPLFQEIRAKRGLVYFIGAGYENLGEPGIFAISASTGKGNAGELLAATIQVLGDFIRQDIPQADLDRARKRIIRGVQTQQESTVKSISRSIALIGGFGRILSLEETNDKLSQVTADSIRHACVQMMASGQYAFASVGPQDTMPTEADMKTLIKAQTVNAPFLQPATISASLSTIAPAFAGAQKNVVLAGQMPQMATLPNGLRVVTVERPGSLSLGIWTGAGSDGETPAESGASHMIEHLMFKGTESYAQGEIDRIVEQDLLGALNAYTSKDRTAYYLYNLDAADHEKGTDICGEMVFGANLDEAEYAGIAVTRPDGTTVLQGSEREVVIQEIKQYQDDVDDRQQTEFDVLAWTGQPHARPILGTEASLRGMDHLALRNYRDSRYVPNNAIFITVGQVSHADHVALIERKYGHLQPSPVEPLPAQKYSGGTAFLEMPLASLCGIKLGAEGVALTHADHMAYNIMTDVLGRGETSRLCTKIVDELELTNGIGAYAASYRNCGHVGIVTSVEAENIRPLINAVYAELRRLTTDAAQHEVDKSILASEVQLTSRTEVNRDACRAYATDTLVYGAPRSSADILAELRKVTVADIRRVASAVLASNPTVSGVVPPGTDPALLPTHAEIVAMRDGTWRPVSTPVPQRPAAPGP
jgi:predicted Zn-dependent peptidase